MKLENQVISLELAKRLKELGVKQESFFYYFEIPSINYCIINNITDKKNDNNNNSPNYASFTVTELCEMLPVMLKVKLEKPYYLSIKKTITPMRYLVSYVSNAIASPAYKLDHKITANGDNLANCLGAILVSLLENKLVSVNEVNHVS